MKKVLLLSVVMLLSVLATVHSAGEKPAAGMLYFAGYGYEDNEDVIRNPYIIGAFYTIMWSEIEKSRGKFDWRKTDAFINKWVGAGKFVALRIMWTSSGMWKNPMAGTPTPAWVWREGAKYAFHAPSKTEIPLFWDPIYRKYAMEFQREVNRKFGNNPHILFIDVTPGAETNPYRFRTIERSDPAFKTTYLSTAASDGRTYSQQLWVETMTGWIAETAKIVTGIPCLVTLNVGGMPGANNFAVIGQCCVDNGMMVGQNGLKVGNYTDEKSERTILYRKWGKQTKLFFEMVAAAEEQDTGTLMEVMEAAERIGCDYLNVYAKDVVKSCNFLPQYTPRWEEAMRYGYHYFSTKQQIQ